MLKSLSSSLDMKSILKIVFLLLLILNFFYILVFRKLSADMMQAILVTISLVILHVLRPYINKEEQHEGGTTEINFFVLAATVLFLRSTNFKVIKYVKFYLLYTILFGLTVFFKIHTFLSVPALAIIVLISSPQLIVWLGRKSEKSQGDACLQRDKSRVDSRALPTSKNYRDTFARPLHS